MIAFIICCSVLALLVQNQSEYLVFLTTNVALTISLSILIISLIIGYLKKLPTIIWHDGFATAGLFVWYGYWQPQFSEDAPMFLFYPVYFALFCGFVTLALIHKSGDFDRQSIEQLRYLDKMMRLDINMAIVFVLISLAIPRHYALYAMAMTFFIVRHTITVCLENTRD